MILLNRIPSFIKPFIIDFLTNNTSFPGLWNAIQSSLNPKLKSLQALGEEYSAPIFNSVEALIEAQSQLQLDGVVGNRKQPWLCISLVIVHNRKKHLKHPMAFCFTDHLGSSSLVSYACTSGACCLNLAGIYAFRWCQRRTRPTHRLEKPCFR